MCASSSSDIDIWLKIESNEKFCNGDFLWNDLSKLTLNTENTIKHHIYVYQKEMIALLAITFKLLRQDHHSRIHWYCTWRNFGRNTNDDWAWNNPQCSKILCSPTRVCCGLAHFLHEGCFHVVFNWMISIKFTVNADVSEFCLVSFSVYNFNSWRINN